MAENTNTGWAGGKNAFGDFAPGMVHYTDKVLFDEVWERPDLSKRDRSLITVAALTAMGKMDQLKFHLGFARENGVTEEELKEAITQLAFYTGWPNGMGAMSVLKGIFEDESCPFTAAGYDQTDPAGSELGGPARFGAGPQTRA